MATVAFESVDNLSLLECSVIDVGYTFKGTLQKQQPGPLKIDHI